MAKKVVRRKKLGIVPFLVFLLIIGIIFGVVFYILTRPTSNLIVKGNDYLTDDYILETAGVKDYPTFLFINNYMVEKKLKKSPYIIKADVKKRFIRKLEINIKENEPLFYDQYLKRMVFEDGSKLDLSYDKYDISRLNNYVPKGKYNNFVLGMKKIKRDVLSKISDIEYRPNDLDKDRFLFYMDDGNSVYLTLTKFSKINYYDESVAQIGGHKGILYLDNGNYFKIME